MRKKLAVPEASALESWDRRGSRDTRGCGAEGRGAHRQVGQQRLLESAVFASVGTCRRKSAAGPAADIDQCRHAFAAALVLPW
jgi:hypothetical protein